MTGVQTCALPISSLPKGRCRNSLFLFRTRNKKHCSRGAMKLIFFERLQSEKRKADSRTQDSSTVFAGVSHAHRTAQKQIKEKIHPATITKYVFKTYPTKISVDIGGKASYACIGTMSAVANERQKIMRNKILFSILPPFFPPPPERGLRL